MKKWLALLLAMVMVLSMVVLAGCGDDKKKDKDDDEDKTTTAAPADPTSPADPDEDEENPSTPVVPDAAPTLIGSWKAEYGNMVEKCVDILGEDFAELMNPQMLYAYYEFVDDTTFKVYIKESDVEAGLAAMLEEAKEIFKDMLDEPIDDSGVTIREMLEAEGYTSSDKYVEDTFPIDEMKDIFALAEDGSYEVVGNTIEFHHGYDEDVTLAVTYTLTATTLTMTMDDGSETMTFTKD